MAVRKFNLATIRRRILPSAISVLSAIYAHSQESFSDFASIHLKAYKISYKTDRSFLGVSPVRLITISRSGTDLISYYEMLQTEADSSFMNRYNNWAFRQSCSSIGRDSLFFRNFVSGDKAYLISFCTVCSSKFNDDCFELKKLMQPLFLSPLSAFRLAINHSDLSAVFFANKAVFSAIENPAHTTERHSLESLPALLTPWS